MVELTDHQFARLMWAVRRAACGRRPGARFPVMLPRVAMIEEAREICVEFEWDFGFKAVFEDARSCRECGCTDTTACLAAAGEPCHWAKPDLCSACAAP